MEGDPLDEADDPLLAQLVDDLPELAGVRGSMGSFMFDLANSRSVALLSDNVMQTVNVPPAAGGPPMPDLFGAHMLVPPMPPPSIPMPSGVSSMFTQMPTLFQGSGEEAEEEQATDAFVLPRVSCPYCGGRATNLGGAAKHKKYAYSCEEPACQQRWNQSRIPDANGDYNVTPSRRAIGNEPRRAGGYSCGKCGAKPKWGHKCPYKDGKPPNLGPSSGTALPPLSSASAANEAKQEGQQSPSADQADNAEAVVLLPHRASKLPTVAPPPPPTPPPVSMQMVSMVRLETAPEVDDDDDDDEAAEDEAAFLADSAADDDEPGNKMQQAQALQLKAMALQQGAMDDQEQATAVDETETETATSPPCKKEKASSGEEAKVDAAMDADDAPTLTGHEVHKILSLVRQRVKGDGSCWVYAILACLGLLEHGHPSKTNDPTPRDRGMDALCRIFAGAWFESHMHSMDLNEHEVHEISTTIETVPEYPCVDAEDMGSFGNMSTIMALAGCFGINVVCWNKKTLRNKAARQQCIEFAPTEEDPQACNERMYNTTEIVSFAHKASVIHIEWDGVNHYAALLSPTVGQIPEHIATVLLTVDPVTHQKPPKPKPQPASKKRKDLISLPSGWTEHTDKIRLDARKCIVIKTKRTTEQHLSEALRDNFNAVVMLSANGENAVKYLRFDFNLTDADCVDTADFNTQLFIHQAGGKRKKIPAPTDTNAACPCRKFYRTSQTEIQCNSCGRWCHTHCAFHGSSDKTIAESVATWICSECSA